MTDASAPKPVLRALSRSLDRLAEDPHHKASTFQIHNLRARRAGSQLFVHLSVVVPGDLTAIQLNKLEKEIVAALKTARKDVKEVQIQFEVISESNGQGETI